MRINEQIQEALEKDVFYGDVPAIKANAREFGLSKRQIRPYLRRAHLKAAHYASGSDLDSFRDNALETVKHLAIESAHRIAAAYHGLRR